MLFVTGRLYWLAKREQTSLQCQGHWYVDMYRQLPFRDSPLHPLCRSTEHHLPNTLDVFCSACDLFQGERHPLKQSIANHQAVAFRDYQH